MHCRCHQLQLAAVNAANEHTEVKRVLGTLLSGKHFTTLQKKSEKLSEIQAELNSPELKMQKPSDTRWLPSLVSTLEEINEQMGDAEAHGIASLLTKYNTVACLYMLSDVLHTVAKLQGSLQGKEVDLASVPSMVESTTQRLKELKENTQSSTWFKDHYAVFTDPSQLGTKGIDVTESMKTQFLQKVYRPYIRSVMDHIGGRLESRDLISSMSVFNFVTFPMMKKKLSDYMA